jgi:outer membrane receptor protein involved in Fe transport
VHQVKAGFDKKNHKIENFAGWAIGGGPFGNTSDASWIMYAFEPEEASFYIQDKMEYKEFIINVGLRYDALDPNSRYPDPSRKLLYEYGGQAYEPSDLSQLSEDQMEGADWGYAALDDDGNPDVDDDGNYVFEAAKWASHKKKWSPRIGFGYPITDNIAFHASYGHFFDYPDLSSAYAFTNTNGAGGLAPGLTGINIDEFNFGNTYAPFPVNTADWYIPAIGSPNVKPEKTVQYEFGFRAYLVETYILSLTVYYKDIYDLISATIYDASPAQYSLYENHDYANSRGFELELRKNFKNNLAWYMNYTLSRAEGSAPNDFFHWDVAYLASVYGWHDYNRTFNMSWDQTHVINYGVDYRHPKGFGLNIIGNYGSGLPYTPTDARGRPIDDPYSARMPSTAIVNMRAYYDLPLKLANVRLYADIDNLLDNSNVNNVFTDTGTPTESTNPNTSPMWMYRPYYWKAPIHIELGITVRL